jgi:hypothetical protein
MREREKKTLIKLMKYPGRAVGAYRPNCLGS